MGDTFLFSLGGTFLIIFHMGEIFWFYHGQERKVSYNSTFIEFVFDIPALSVDVICISWETCYWKVCFQFCGQIFLNKCGRYFFILKNPLLNIFFLFLLCLKKFFFLFFCVEKLTSQISWWKLRNKYSFMLFWN